MPALLPLERAGGAAATDLAGMVDVGVLGLARGVEVQKGCREYEVSVTCTGGWVEEEWKVGSWVWRELLELVVMLGLFGKGLGD